jgi:hypothetical protein
MVFHSKKRAKKKKKRTLPLGSIVPQPPEAPHEPEPVLTYDFEHCRTRLDHTGPYVVEDVIAAIRETGGNFTHMSSLLGRRRSSVRDHVFANLDIKEVYDEEREGFLDQAEKMHNTIALLGDGQALRFVLQTLGKGRGYTTRQEQTGPNGGPIETKTIVYVPDNGREGVHGN